jgi:asparagine synthase (glutamine-hydrolysing)
VPIQENLINASHWHKDSYLHYVFYSVDLKMLSFLKQQTMQLNNFCPQKIAFQSYYQNFACLIYDTLEQDFFLIRDHFGFEPFYYTIIEKSNQLCFGSTLPDILLHIKNPQLDNEYIEDVLADICVSSLTYTEKTFYQTIFRVTPGNIFHLKIIPRFQLERHIYWRLDPGTPFIRYSSNEEYDEHFGLLLEEACRHACGSGSVGLEFSGGLDSSTILTALDKQNITAKLFMHIGAVKDEREYGEQLLNELKNSYQTHYIDAEAFDLIRVLDEHKKWFAGGAPYLFFMFAANVHQAVQQQGCNVLLSGFGGDECVSSHAPLRTWGAEAGLKALFQELNPLNHGFKLKKWLQMVTLAYPNVYYRVQYLKSYRSALARKQLPTHYKPYTSIQEREADWLTGSLSYHVRMRIEYSAVVAKNRNFSYQYPLLYPPFVDYCFQLPPEQKRRQGQHRLLMRRYLANNISSGLFNDHKKCGDILPGTLPKSQQLHQNGLLEDSFQTLPFTKRYDDIIEKKLVTHDRLFHLDLLRYMFKWVS